MRTSVVALLLATVCTLPSYAQCWGIDAPFANEPSAQSTYEAEVMRQRGVGCIFLDMRGGEYNWPNWLQVKQEWNKARAKCYWDLPTTLAECEHILGFEQGTFDTDDRAVNEDGSRGYFGSDPPLGNFFSEFFVYQTERVAKAMAPRLRPPGGYRMTANADLRNGSFDEEAAKSWQSFLKKFFADKSPNQDTNTDSCTFNSAYGTDYSAWDEVPLFTSKDRMEDRKRRLADLWLADAYASYVDRLCGGVLALDKSADVGPGVNEHSDVGVLASKPNVKVIYTDSVELAPALDSFAAAFGKHVIAAGVPLIPGDLEKSRQRALKLLPYTTSAFFDYDGLVRERTEGTPAKITKFDPAFQVLPELAPFVGKFQLQRANVLWIVPDNASGVPNSYCVSESALALDPKCVDPGKYDAVVYASSSPCPSLAMMQELFEYAVAGGVVVLDAFKVANGPTLRGRDNRQFWWQDMTPKRESEGEGTTEVTYAGDTWTVRGVHPYLIGDPGKLREEGTIEDSTGARYPLLLIRSIGGAGKWVFVNLPDFTSHSSLLAKIVERESRVKLRDPSENLVYRGEQCVLALGGSRPSAVTVDCPSEKAVVFDVLARTARVVEARDGRIELANELSPAEARLWVVKPCDKPRVIYADGTINHAASTDDGTYADGVLEFEFAESACIISPSRPTSLTINGETAPFNYDPDQHIVTITRDGASAKARLMYAD